MTSRTWINDGGIALSAANLNSLESDVDKGLSAFSAVNSITVNSWQPSTVYALNKYILDPSGNTVKVTTAHTSTTTYDATKFTAVAATIGDATVAGYLNTPGSASSNSLNVALAAATRTNWAPNPTFAKNTTVIGYSSGTGGVVALSWQSGSGSDGLPGFARATFTTGTTGGGGGMNAGLATPTPTIPIPVGSYAVGDSYMVSAWVRSSKATTVNWGGYFRTGSTGQTAAQTAFTLSANTWTRVSRLLTVGAATSDNLYWYCYASGSNTWGTGDTLDVDGILVEKTATLGTYFDGGLADTATTHTEWLGTPHASASTQKIVPSALKPYMSRTGAAPVGRGEFVINVADYLAPNRVIGVTDDLPAFQAALAAASFGAIRLFVPAGDYYISSAILLPSNCEFFGAGIQVSRIFLMTTSALDTWVVTNATPLTGGNQFIHVHDITLDWQGSATRNGSGGGTRSSCLTFRNVQWFWIDRVEAANGGQHGIDIAQGSIDYPYFANGTDGGPEPTDPSRFGWIRNCRMNNWGDDGITTHHSEYLWIENNYGRDPRKRDNCNGIEVDDGSRHVFLKNNMSENCFAGIEVKAHANVNAAQDVHIDGHFSIRDVRSYHWRHIGHHLGPNPDTGAPGDPVSTTAFDITATNLVSFMPGNRTGFQDESTPSALNIAAYVNVSVSNFTAIGDPSYDFAGENVVTLKYLTNNVSLKNFNIRNFKGSGADIYVTGGYNKADRVTIDGVSVKNSSPTVIGIGSLQPMVSISNVNAVAPATGATYAIDAGYSNSNVHITDTLNLVGYPTEIRYDGTNYATAAKFFRRAVNVPVGVTTMKALDPTVPCYYADTTTFSGFTTDRPSGAAGAYWIQHSHMSGGNVLQTITRNTTGTPTQYWRVVDTVANATSPWMQPTLNVVANSAT